MHSTVATTMATHRRTNHITYYLNKIEDELDIHRDVSTMEPGDICLCDIRVINSNSLSPQNKPRSL